MFRYGWRVTISHRINWTHCHVSPAPHHKDPESGSINSNFSVARVKPRDGGMNLDHFGSGSVISYRCLKFIVAFRIHLISDIFILVKNWTRYDQMDSSQLYAVSELCARAPVSAKESWNASFWIYFPATSSYQNKRDVGQLHLYKAIYPAWGRPQLVSPWNNQVNANARKDYQRRMLNPQNGWRHVCFMSVWWHVVLLWLFVGPPGHLWWWHPLQHSRALQAANWCCSRCFPQATGIQ